MADDYDLVVLGTGSAGSIVAQRCRAAGWRVAIADDRPFGGTCALRGCEPKKALRTVVEAVDRARRLGPMGVEGAARVDWSAAMAFKRSFTRPVPDRRADSYAEAGIEALNGAARFVAPDVIAVGERLLQARHVLVATGATPTPVDIDGAEHLLTSDDVLELDPLPDSLVLLGGGYISFEFAHIAARSGAKVTILHKDQRPLAKFDPDLVGRVVAHSRRIGVAVELGAEAERIEKGRGGRVAVRTRDGRGFEAAAAVHGLGRVPNIDRLDLRAGGVELDGKKLKLDRFLRSTSNPRVFAAGDAAGRGPALTPIASLDADCVAENLLQGCRREPDYTGFGGVVFTIPALTAVGITAEEAREAGRDVEVKAGDMDDYQSVQREGFAGTGTAFRVVIERGTRRILGAHLFAPGAEEVINMFALSVRLGLTADDLGRLLSAYPSEGSNVASMLK